MEAPPAERNGMCCRWSGEEGVKRLPAATLTLVVVLLILDGDGDGDDSSFIFETPPPEN